MKLPRHKRPLVYLGVGALVCAVFVYVVGYSNLAVMEYRQADAQASVQNAAVATPTLDIEAYNNRLLALAHIRSASTTTDVQLALATSSKLTLIISGTATTSVLVPGRLWPTPTTYPQAGALLPFSRIVAYYGNFYSTGMGILGEYPPEQVLAKLKDVVAQWQAADPTTPVIPAIDYIAVTAQASAGADGMYRARMPSSQIDKALALAKEVNGIVVLDVQVGLSTLPKELPPLQKYLSMPQVHLAIDPEFSMKDGVPPGHEIGTFNAADVNYAAGYLASLVDKNHLPPKILIVHRFTEDMVTGYRSIKPLPQVQVVMDMDGWGFPAKKINTYQAVISPEPIQFTGFKLFYKNDLKPPSTALLTPAQVLSLTPAPIFIQYQ